MTDLLIDRYFQRRVGTPVSKSSLKKTTGSFYAHGLLMEDYRFRLMEQF